MRLGLVLCGIVLVGAAAPVRAADEPGVARVSLIEGEASYLRGDADDWTGVSVNAPLVTGDRFYSAANSRAEIQLDPSDYARLSSETEVGMLELGPEVTQVRVSIGLASFRVRHDPGQRHVEIDTPGAALVVDRAGVYRIGVERNGDTSVQVREGAATMYVAGQEYRLGEGRGASIEGIGDAARPRISAVSGGDAFDDWEKQRDARVESAVSTQYVSQGIYGAEDLDANGTWQYDQQYGNVWRPDVGPGWAPYTDGRWVWVDPWGWTWLDYSSWGWAPFHYGRWVYTGGYWGWAPGPIVATPVYAPALVGWYGGGWGGVSVSVGVGFGTIGWTPLGWGEPCFPWWGGFGGVVAGHPWWGGWGGPRVYNNVVINKNVNINVNNYNFGNRRNPGGFSTMPVGDFRNGRGRITPVGYQRQGGFRVFDGHVPVAPTRASLPATNPSRVAIGRGMQPPSAINGRRVVTMHMPSSTGQPSFARKLPVLEHSQGTPLTPATLREMGKQGGRAPLVQSAVNPNARGRQLATVPETGRDGRSLPGAHNEQGVTRALPHEGGGGRAVASGEPASPGSYPRTGVPRAGSEPDRNGSGGRPALTSPGSRSPTRGASAPRVGALDGAGGGRTVARPPAEVDAPGRAIPVAPRAGGVNHTPYVAPRPAWNGASGSSGARDVGGAQPRAGFASGGGSEPARHGGGSPYAGSGTSYQGARGGSAPHPAYGSSSAPPAPRSYVPAGGGVPPAGSEPATGRSAGAVPHAQTGSRGFAPSAPAAPPPGRGGSSRNYFSQPHTLAPWVGATSGVAHARTAPTYRSATANPRGYAAPQVRAPSAYAQRGYAAPAGRGARYPSSGGGGFTAPRSAPSSSGRSFAGRFSGGGMARSGGMAGGGHFGGRGG